MPIALMRVLIPVLAAGLSAGCGSGEGSSKHDVASTSPSTSAPTSQIAVAGTDTPNWNSYGGIRASAQKAVSAGLREAECPLPVDIRAALTGAGVTAALTRPRPLQIDIDGTGRIENGPSSTPGMVAIECSLGTADTNGTKGWEFDVFLIAVKDGQARSQAYAARYQEKELLTMPGAFNPGDTLLAPSTGGTAIYHLRVTGGDAILEASSGAHGEQYNVYDAKLTALTKALGDQFQKAAAAS